MLASPVLICIASYILPEVVSLMFLSMNALFLSLNLNDENAKWCNWIQSRVFVRCNNNCFCDSHLALIDVLVEIEMFRIEDTHRVLNWNAMTKNEWFITHIMDWIRRDPDRMITHSTLIFQWKNVCIILFIFLAVFTMWTIEINVSFCEKTEDKNTRIRFEKSSKSIRRRTKVYHQTLRTFRKCTKGECFEPTHFPESAQRVALSRKCTRRGFC